MIVDVWCQRSARRSERYFLCCGHLAPLERSPAVSVEAKLGYVELTKKTGSFTKKLDG